MRTAQELANEAHDLLGRAAKAQEDGDKEAFDKIWTEYEAKQKEAAEAADAAAKVKQALEKYAPKPSEMRDPADALIKTVKPEDAQHGVLILKEDGNGAEVVQFADKDTEGWIKGYPAACQHPKIVRCLTPELKEEAAFYSNAFAKWMRKGPTALDTKEIKALQEGTDSEGGYLVPSDAVRLPYIHDPGAPGGVTRPISSTFTTTRDAGDWPTVGSVSWAAVAEEGALPSTTDPTFGQVTFTIRKIMGMHKVSTELLEDSAVDLGGIISLIYGESLGRYEDQQAIEGDGSSEPQGLRVASVSDTTNKIDASDGWNEADLIDAFFELPAQFRQNATWHMTSTTLGRIAGIESTAGAISFIRSIADPVSPNIMGKPYALFDGTGWDTALSGTNEYGAIGDFRQYYFINRVGMSIRRLNELYAGNDQVGFVARVRYDSVVALTNAFLILKGQA